jgi:hypothetical protein
LKEGSILFKWDRKKWNLNFRHSIFTRISDLQKNKIDLASKYIRPMCKKIIFFCLTNKKKGGKSTPLFLASFIWKINVDSKLKIKWRKEKVEKTFFGSNFFSFFFLFKWSKFLVALSIEETKRFNWIAVLLD